MNAQEIKATLAEINRKKYELEAALEENGGELTPELLESLEILEELKALLAGDGVDDRFYPFHGCRRTKTHDRRHYSLFRF